MKKGYLTLDEHRHIHKHIVKLPYGALQLHDIVVSGFNVSKSLLRLLRVRDDALREDAGVPAFDHLLQGIVAYLLSG